MSTHFYSSFSSSSWAVVAAPLPLAAGAAVAGPPAGTAAVAVVAAIPGDAAPQCCDEKVWVWVCMYK